MSEFDFPGLRRHLEEGTVTPPFAEINRRRGRRVRRLAVTGAAAVTLIVLVGAVATFGRGRSALPPVTPSPTTSTSPSPSASLSPSPPVSPPPAITGPHEVISLTGTVDGVLYGVTAGKALLRLDPGSPQWTVAGTVPFPGDLRYGNANSLWLDGGAEAAWSGNGGQTWMTWVLPVQGYPRAVNVGEGVLWLARGSHIFEVTLDKGLVEIPAPAGVAEISFLAMGTRDTVVISGGPENVGDFSWYQGGSSGWTRFTHPCTVTRWTSGQYSTAAETSDRGLWVVCQAGFANGLGPKDLLVRGSADSNWINRGALEELGYGADVYPFSDKVAWRTGSRADVYRTTDGGVRWQSVAGTQPDGPRAFVALNPATAAYVMGTAPGTVQLTRDGGKMWTAIAFPSSP